MKPGRAVAGMNAPLSHWLRLLWDMAPPLRLGSDSPYIADGTIHLPARAHWRSHSAAAAHAAAHLVYSPQRFDGEGLDATGRQLLALLEDARVEALAVRELPGLARIWRPLHTASADFGGSVGALMLRLARALIDPFYVDPHPWVRRGKDLFFLDDSRELLALRTPAEVRRAAIVLGLHLGEAKPPAAFRPCPPSPQYRDDHRWMWAADRPAVALPASAQGGPLVAAASESAEPLAWHPEWRYLLGRLRALPGGVAAPTAAEAPLPARASPADSPRGRPAESPKSAHNPPLPRRRARASKGNRCVHPACRKRFTPRP